MKNANLVLKRFFDIIFSLIGIIVLIIIPVFIIVPLLIRVTSPGPAIFTQIRAGKDKKLFKMYKFRSMIVERIDNEGKEILPEDRLTKVGKFIRKTSIDELPQLINILLGSMSFIGPRPMLEYQANRCNDEQSLRFSVKPGITGLAQVSGRNNITWPERIKYDVKYVENYNLLLDISILFKTVLTVFKRKGTQLTVENREVDPFSIHYKENEKNSLD